ncbi:hypothetical protein OG336_09135 [[Kitasatospora] papulosa]|uniref:hypothetical protein n=1 Tax=[Kitasatospora] papulosa TaxID=1464011 RepID=UPI002E14EE27|nr:hypothetical protein OG336_09135 [[Kitasatospora] papulosa]
MRAHVPPSVGPVIALHAVSVAPSSVREPEPGGGAGEHRIPVGREAAYKQL